MLISPIVAAALTVFMVGRCAGRRIGWDAQQRSRTRLRWFEATASLWLQTLAGVAMTLWLLTAARWAFIFAAPILLAVTASIPIAVISILPALSRWSLGRGFFDISEDRVRHRERMRTAERYVEAAE